MDDSGGLDELIKTLTEIEDSLAGANRVLREQIIPVIAPTQAPPIAVRVARRMFETQFPNESVAEFNARFENSTK